LARRDAPELLASARSSLRLGADRARRASGRGASFHSPTGDIGAERQYGEVLFDLLTTAARRAPDTAAVITEHETVSFARLVERVHRRGAQLAARTALGDRVAVLAENRAEYVELYYAAPLAGRVLVPLNHRLHPDEWRATIARAGVRLVYGAASLLERLDTRVPTIDLDARSTAPAAGDWLPPRRGDTDVAWLIGTSGTTGDPKLAMLSDASLLAAVDATLTARPVGPTDVLATPFPLCHVAGYNVMVLHRRARPIVLQRTFDPVGFADLVRTHGVTMLSLAPTMIAMLLDHPDVTDADLATVRALGYGASPIPGPVLARVVERWDWDCSQGFGMTELSGNAIFLGPDEHRAAARGDSRLLVAAGRPAPGVDVRLGDGDELLVRAPQVMLGYWNDPDATATAIGDGWLHTGDVARIDPDGIVTIVDRTKDIIVSGGENVASREVEEVLHTHPAVRDVAVVGVPDPRWGEVVCAVVVTRASVTADDLIAHCRSRLAGFKSPRRIEFVAELPRNGSGKVLKHQLRSGLVPAP
jgi:acyl-CoA synthetase (AMP-forming)/AMP-acid ligase II